MRISCRCPTDAVSASDAKQLKSLEVRGRRELRASTIVSNLNPKLLYAKLVERNPLDEDTVDAYAPNFARSVLGYQALSPLDLERRIGLVGGDIFHGALGLDHVFSARPLLGQGNYRGAFKHLYLCGAVASSHAVPR